MLTHSHITSWAKIYYCRHSFCPRNNLSVWPVCLTVWLTVCLTVCITVCPTVCLTVCLTVYITVCITVCLTVCVTVCLLVCITVSYFCILCTFWQMFTFAPLADILKSWWIPMIRLRRLSTSSTRVPRPTCLAPSMSLIPCRTPSSDYGFGDLIAYLCVCRRQCYPEPYYNPNRAQKPYWAQLIIPEEPTTSPKSCPRDWLWSPDHQECRISGNCRTYTYGWRFDTLFDWNKSV